ncbi:type II glyceraldehyde-3-phosphate dehydrogenase [Tumebacillus algifaecis]|uniref:Type II glyceraldehyde-3-phosphate dehydrogenase n=1 Tax=Tumebacillus algifaecis TaxID=1214604 RepID=A0A223CWH2_9BACL|nr:type II glyceraldehyde-3-phosphate dehydrogenase [Tumebacillus algifaecis]ASS73662.1 type II glyceraldehyde-3-phosphate dehydrogenase [Tumebacillus algifaecis]
MMKSVRIGVIGCGTIGKRVADAVRLQSDMQLVGIGLRTPNPTALSAHLSGIPLFCTDPMRFDRFEKGGLPCAGGLRDLLSQVDVILDCTQAGEGAKRLALYQEMGVKSIFQGGEKHATTGLTFSTFGNFEDAIGRSAVRVGSCNTTGLVRLLSTLDRYWGVKHAEGSLVRCSTDPDKAENGLPNGAAPVFGLSHHGPDAQLVMPTLSIFTQAVAVPMFFSHVQMMSVKLNKPADRDEVMNVLCNTPRILVESHRKVGKTTAQLSHYYAETPRMRGDRQELLLWEESIVVEGDQLHAMTSIDMQCITIPETIDCIRAVMGLETERNRCMWQTDSALGIQKHEVCYQPSSLTV